MENLFPRAISQVAVLERIFGDCRESQKLSIFELCNFPIEKAEWKFNNKSYFAFIEQTVRSMNPKMENIYRTIQKEKQSQTFGNAESIPFKQGTIAQGGRLDGKTANIFYQGETLRKAYEAVPESRRMYLGDMDTRDWDFIRILYHPDQKREV